MPKPIKVFFRIGLISLLIGPPSYGQQHSSIYLKNINSAEHQLIEDVFENQDIVMLFQPDCSVCKSQIQEMQCLPTYKLLGTNGSEQKLSEDYIRFKTKAPVFMIHLKQLQKLNPKLQIVTPQFFYIFKNTEGTLRFKNLGFGYKKCDDLKTQISSLKNHK